MALYKSVYYYYDYYACFSVAYYYYYTRLTIAGWLACWTQAQKGPGSNRSRNDVRQQS